MKTVDSQYDTTIENPMPVEDLHATIYHALGIPADTSYVVEKRPVYVTRDVIGKPAAAKPQDEGVQPLGAADGPHKIRQVQGDAVHDLGDRRGEVLQRTLRGQPGEQCQRAQVEL
jgi:hypothetical protein